MSNLPPISVVVPVHKTNSELFRACVTSIQNQTGELDVELIIVFDGQPDEELASIAAKVSNHMRCKIVMHSEQGVSATRNVGIDMARGMWIAFVDADDSLPENALRDLLQYGERNNCDIVMGDHVSLLGTAHEKHEYHRSDEVLRGEGIRQFRRDVLRPQTNAGLVWGKVYKLDLLKEHEVRFDESLAVAEDSDFVFRVTGYARSIGLLHENVYFYHRNANSTVRAFSSDYVTRIEAAMEAMWIQIKDSPDRGAYAALFQSYVAFHLLLILVNYIFNPKAPWTRKERRAEYMRILRKPLFATALRDVDLDSFSVTRRISLVTLRFRLFSLSKAIGFIRQTQLR